MSRRSEHFCAFCSSPMKLPAKKTVGIWQLLWASTVSFALTLLIWQEIDPKGILFLPMLIGLTEVFFVLRWRLAIVCRSCGFDPALYLKSSEKACDRVREHYEIHKLKANRPLLVHPLDRMQIDRMRKDRQPKEKVTRESRLAEKFT